MDSFIKFLESLCSSIFQRNAVGVGLLVFPLSYVVCYLWETPFRQLELIPQLLFAATMTIILIVCAIIGIACFRAAAAAAEKDDLGQDSIVYFLPCFLSLVLIIALHQFGGGLFVKYYPFVIIGVYFCFYIPLMISALMCRILFYFFDKRPPGNVPANTKTKPTAKEEGETNNE